MDIKDSKNEQPCTLRNVICSLTDIDIILKHSFPNGKDGDYNPKFRMNNPKKDYVLNQELNKILKILDVKE